VTDGELVVHGLAIEQIGDRACAAGIALHQLAAQVGSLEDLFLQWTGDTGRHEAAPVHGKGEKEVAQR
jgi:ABC-2 type transport system ATP-binding protein